MSHLFSFFAEEGSGLWQSGPSPLGPVYLRVQLARYLIEEGVEPHGADAALMSGDASLDFGISTRKTRKPSVSAYPFMTTGLPGPGRPRGLQPPLRQLPSRRAAVELPLPAQPGGDRSHRARNSSPRNMSADLEFGRGGGVEGRREDVLGCALPVISAAPDRIRDGIQECRGAGPGWPENRFDSAHRNC